MKAEIDISELILGDRFDIFIKVYYLEKKLSHQPMGRLAYWLSIHCINNFIEYDENRTIVKCGYNDFKNSFDRTYNSIADSGFLFASEEIPTAGRKPLNGAHRISIALKLGKKIKIEEVDRVFNFDFSFYYFLNQKYPTVLLERVFSFMFNTTSNIYCACLFPSSATSQDFFVDLLSNECKVLVDYKRDFNETGQRLLMSVLYPTESWLGSRETNYNGAKNKYEKCFNGSHEVRFVCFQFNDNRQDLQKVLEFKDKYRDIAQKDKHSIHITDNDFESKHLLKFTLNTNNYHWLNKQRVKYFEIFEGNLSNFDTYLKKCNLSVDDVIIVGGSVLSAYGLRDSKDIDFIVKENSMHKPLGEGIYDCHNKYFNDLGINCEQYFDSDFTFDYSEYKFLSLHLIKQFKIKRNEPKDKVDLQLIKQVESNDLWDFSNLKFYLSVIRCYLFNIRLKATIKILLYKLGLYK